MAQSTERPDGCGPSSHRSVMSCAVAISVPTHIVEAMDLWVGILLVELRFLDQRHANSVAFQDHCSSCNFAAMESQFHCMTRSGCNVLRGVKRDCT